MPREILKIIARFLSEIHLRRHKERGREIGGAEVLRLREKIKDPLRVAVRHRLAPYPSVIHFARGEQGDECRPKRVILRSASIAAENLVNPSEFALLNEAVDVASLRR